MATSQSRQFCLPVIFLVMLFTFTLRVHGASSSPPTIRLFETDSDNKIQKVLNVGPNSEAILENVGSVRLECSADYPVQWIYSGNGVPVMEEKIIKTSETEFRSVAFISQLSEQHTGKYKCASTERPNELTYFYIYVPGPVLFSSTTGRDLDVGSNSIQIPCTVSSPRIAVYLQKPAGTPLEGQAQYDPRRGFYFQVLELKQAEGVYLCKATYRGSTNVLEYKVHVLNAPAPIQDDETPKKENGTDKSPCNPPCAPNAKCLFTGVGQPSICQCLDPYRGDGYRTCAPKQGECSTHTDCPDHHSCFADFVCRDPCTNTLHGLECGTNAVCKTVSHQPTCACPGGSSGDPLRNCASHGFQQGDQPTRAKPGRATTVRPSISKPYPSGDKKDCACGPDCECICRTDSDCQNGHVCNGTRCEDPCKNLCGRNAICKAIQGAGLCSCPRGYRGDPWKSCTRIDSNSRKPDPQEQAPNDEGTKPALTCSTNADCPSKYYCENGLKCVDPCDNCVPNANCDLFDGGSMPKCRCLEGYTGDGTISCTPDLNFEIYPSSTNFSTETQNACSSISCGQNGECRIYDGLPKCGCQSGYVGNPPNCKAECKANSDCKDHQVCIQKRCRSACFGKCGTFARCVADAETKTPKCVCRKGYTGDPLKECIRDPRNTRGSIAYF